MAGEALPDSTSTVKALRYVQTQAVHGHFKGRSTALLVLYYLVTNMWVRPSGDGQGLGEVVYSRSAIASICEGTALGRTAVKAALHWLAEEEWIDTQRSVDDNGREVHRYIYVKLDMPGHRERERRRAVTKAAERILAEASRP
jgi:hypothetical protein